MLKCFSPTEINVYNSRHLQSSHHKNDMVSHTYATVISVTKTMGWDNCSLQDQSIIPTQLHCVIYIFISSKTATHHH